MVFNGQKGDVWQPYLNRQQAGQELAKELQKLKLNPQKSIVCAIARGGVVVGQEVSRKLGIPLRVIVIRKLGAPGNPELAIGAVSALGKPVLDWWLIGELGVKSSFIKKETSKKREEAEKREKFLGVKLGKKDFVGKTVIVIDDGLATGQSARAAARLLAGFGVKKLILAVPCGFPGELEKLKDDFAKVICLKTSYDFRAVGQFYRDFRPVEDQEVKELLDHN